MMQPSPAGYVADASENPHSELHSDFSADETFWSVWSTPPHLKMSPDQSPITLRKKKLCTKTPEGKVESAYLCFFYTRDVDILYCNLINLYIKGVSG